MPKIDKGDIAVLLLNLGGPDSLAAVRPFLFNLFSDREIIRLGPSFMQKPFAYLISRLRSGKTESLYKLIGGKSPIHSLTLAQASGLEAALGHEFRVYIGMRYWTPFINETVARMRQDGIRRAIVLSLYPQYSLATTGSSLSELARASSDSPIKFFSIKNWFGNPLYIDALVDMIWKGLRIFEKPDKEPVHVLFSAHSLPKKFIDEGDPYADQIIGTIREINNKISINWSLSYQSKSGPVAWLEPSTELMIEELAGKGVKNLLVVPISFVSDHIETLYEIDILYKKMAETLGIRLERTESLNTSPLFISALGDIVRNGLKEAGWAE